MGPGLLPSGVAGIDWTGLRTADPSWLALATVAAEVEIVQGEGGGNRSPSTGQTSIPSSAIPCDQVRRRTYKAQNNRRVYFSAPSSARYARLLGARVLLHIRASCSV